MGFFDFFKGIKKAKETEVKKLKLYELNPIINLHLEEASRIANSELEILREKIVAEKYNLLKKIENLEEAEIINTTIPEKIKHIAHGNREVYSEKLKSFLNKLNPPSEPSKVLQFYDSFDKSFEDLRRSTIKSHNIMQEIFIKETSPITKGMQSLDFLTKEAKRILESSNIQNINKLKEEFENLKQKIKQKEKLENDIKLENIEREEKNKKVNDKEGVIKNLENSKEYQEFLDDVANKTLLEQEINSTREQILRPFYSIEAALKKYANLNKDDKLVKRYLGNPLKALMEDEELSILIINSEIRRLIAEEKIELKDKKKDKILDEINKLTEDYIKKFLSRYNKLTRKMEEAKTKIEKSRISKQIWNIKEEVKQDKEHFDKENKIEKMIKELSEINLEELKTNLERNFNVFLKEAIKIDF